MPLIIPGRNDIFRHSGGSAGDAATPLTAAEKNRLNNTLLQNARYASVLGCNQAIDAGADVNVQDDEGKSGMYLAAAGGCTGTYMEIGSRGGDTEVCCNQGGTALHAAAIGWPNAGYNVEIMLWYGADIDACDNKGRTALHWIMLHIPRNHQTAEALLREGSDVNATDYEGSTPLDLLLSFHAKRHPQSITLLKQWGGITHHEHPPSSPSPASTDEEDDQSEEEDTTTSVDDNEDSFTFFGIHHRVQTEEEEERRRDRYRDDTMADGNDNRDRDDIE